ncbi:metalloregulator ArsR/SmtB family transcription factor [Thiomonas sp. FB-Cd]|uniref:ArsR/SmtB family transcription factor n=1 Tax=Thiomonas sp. FB-Cd TaxID=1158292 RepID=UPI00057112F3|nr:metalloregulator ArsR/SmtB family transcription factor [Thiomonas sp. FB-Cd]
MSALPNPLSLLAYPTVQDDEAAQRVFTSAAELFGVLATPLRLRILNAICDREKGVNDIVDAVHSTQPNVSQHLKVLYLAGIVTKRRLGNQIYYKVQSEKAMQLCRTVCTQIAIELADPDAIGDVSRLASKRSA